MKIKKIVYYLAALMLAGICGGKLYATETSETENKYKLLKDFYFSEKQGFSERLLKALETAYVDAKGKKTEQAEASAIANQYIIRFALKNRAAELKEKSGMFPTYLTQNIATTVFYDDSLTERVNELSGKLKGLAALAKDSTLQQALYTIIDPKIQRDVLTRYFIVLEKYAMLSQQEQVKEAPQLFNELNSHLEKILGKDDSEKFIKPLLDDSNGLYSVLQNLSKKEEVAEEPEPTTIEKSKKKFEFDTWLDVRTKFNELKAEKNNWKNYLSDQQKTKDYLNTVVAIIKFAKAHPPTVSAKQALTIEEQQEIINYAAVLAKIFEEFNEFFKTNKSITPPDEIVNAASAQLMQDVKDLSSFESQQKIFQKLTGSKIYASSLFDALEDDNKQEYQKRVIVLLDAIANYVLKVKTHEQILADLKQGLGDDMYKHFIKQAQNIKESIVYKLVPPVEVVEEPAKSTAVDTLSSKVPLLATALAVLAVVK